VDTNRKTALRILDLMEAVLRDPFAGIGKPEPLKGDFQGWWSRRITDKDRLVYRIEGKGSKRRLEIAQCRLHY